MKTPEEKGWDKTEKGKNPSTATIFIDTTNIQIDEWFKTKSVKDYLEGKNNPKDELNLLFIEPYHNRWNETDYVSYKLVYDFLTQFYGSLLIIIRGYEKK
jgi:hypothetical protein